MDITIRRESVCMGDDVEDHTLTYTIDSSTSLSDIFQDLIRRGYFPKISGNDVVWTLLCGEADLITWKTKENKLYRRFAAGEPSILSVKCQKAPTIMFNYYSPPIKRGQHIFTMFHGNKSLIQSKGFMPEYESYCIPQAIEDDWQKMLS